MFLLTAASAVGPRVRSKVILGLSAFCLAAATAFGGAPAASAHTCGRVAGMKVHAYNLSCARARSIYGGQPPKGWTAGNIDVAGGLAFYCRAADEEVVDEAIDPRTGRVRVGRLHGAPLIIAAVPYGE
jgi:hypothetical protein